VIIDTQGADYQLKTKVLMSLKIPDIDYRKMRKPAFQKTDFRIFYLKR